MSPVTQAILPIVAASLTGASKADHQQLTEPKDPW